MGRWRGHATGANGGEGEDRCKIEGENGHSELYDTNTDYLLLIENPRLNHYQDLETQCSRISGGREHLLPHFLKPRTLRLRTLNIRRNFGLPALHSLIHPEYHKLNLLNVRDRSLYRFLLFLRWLVILSIHVRRGVCG